MLRESCELNSAEVAVVHCGERVLLLQEAGRPPKTLCEPAAEVLGIAELYARTQSAAMLFGKLSSRISHVYILARAVK